jgi:hypothetical protein
MMPEWRGPAPDCKPGTDGQQPQSPVSLKNIFGNFDDIEEKRDEKIWLDPGVINILRIGACCVGRISILYGLLRGQ